MSSSSEDGLERAAPETTGVASEDIISFLEDATKSEVELHTFMLYRSGAVIVEATWWPYRQDLPHMLHSATKSFLSVAVGLAINEGFFKLDTTIISLFPDRLPTTVSQHLAEMTVEDLLTQTSGHGHGVSGGEWRGIKTSWINEFFSLPVVHKPGTEFVYTSATSFMLSAIVTQTTGQTVRDFLEPRLFRPLGIKLLTWDVGPENICSGGNGISCLPSDFLKLGILHLQKGKWQGQQVLPESWVTSSTKSQRGNLHGYHWWTDATGNYWASGMFGQFAVVFPEHDAVLVTTGAVPEGASRLQSVLWRHFPRIFETSSQLNTSLQGTAKQLADYVATLRVLPPFESLQANSLAISRVSRERFAVKENEDGISSFTLDFRSDHCVFHLQDERGFHQVRIGMNDWQESETSLPGARLHHGYEPARLRVVAGGKWTSTDTFQMTMQFNETAFRNQITIRFLHNYTIASLDRSVNVNSFSTRRPTIFGAILKSGNELSSVEFLDAVKVTVQYSTSTSTIGELLDNSITRQVLLDEIPDLLKDSRLEKARRYTLDLVAHHVGLNESDLDRISVRLSSCTH